MIHNPFKSRGRRVYNTDRFPLKTTDCPATAAGYAMYE
jgi:hypothetical protein